MTEQALPEESIFAEALEIESLAEREAFLARACDGNPSLRAEVESLLRADQRSGDLLDLPETRTAAAFPRPIAEQPGTIIGRYKLLEMIAEGGMGIVYMAEQREPVRRKVALKIIKPGMDTREVISRFEAERQALAMMDHPNIAKVFDAGETESGRSYFVMELVRGIPLTDFCDQNELTIRERLELFVQVCQTVNHAHQKGIIHRDLKPSNVLVTLYDGVPVPKIIDFGIAKAVNGPLTQRTLFTHYGQMIGTPLYMSPEQAEMSDLDVDTRSDIYSLGVMLYELLTGGTPFDHERVKKAGYDEIRRIIREDDPPQPSARISTLGAAAATVVSAQRKTDPTRLSGILRRDLDWIVMKALEKDRTRRYETASDFAHDIQRYLADEPIEARRPALRERLAKWARRHRKIVSSAAVFLFGGAAAAIFLGIVFLVSTGEGTVKLEFTDADAARQCSVSVDGNEILIENLGEPIKLRAGKHRLRVRHGDLEIETRQFNIVKNGTQLLHVSMPSHRANTSGHSHSGTGKPEMAAKTAPARQNPLLPNIVFGEWFPLLPPAGQFLGWDALKDQVRYSKRTLDTPDKEWSPLLTSPDQLVGWEGLNDRVRYSNRTIETRVRVGIAYPLIAKDVSIRARAKKVSGERIWLVLRSSANGRYAAVFNGVGGPFCIVRFSRDNSHVRLAEVVAPETCDNFFDFRFSAVGDALTVFVNDKPLLRTHDSSLTDGTLEIGGDGDGSFTDVAIFIPTEESLLADNRELRGPFADPLVLDEACTRLLKKEPDNFALYKQCAALRARYAQKWSQAAEDLAKAIELNPDDLESWHHRAILLVKLQQKDLLVKHLSRMLAKFQDISELSPQRIVIQSLTTYPTGSPKLIQGGELLAGKLPNDGESRFWLAIARYRAGKCEEAESLFSTAEAEAEAESLFSVAEHNELPIFEAFHAMIKAELNDPQKAKELLSKARAALKKEMLDKKLTDHGDYGDKWWDRLRTEAILAEAESLITGAKP